MSERRSAAPRAPRGPNAAKPGRPRLPSPIASKDSAIDYLRKTGLDPEYLGSVTRIWRRMEAQRQQPPPAKIVRAETKRALRASDDLLEVLEGWKGRSAWSEPSAQEFIASLERPLASLSGLLRASLAAPASGPHVTLAHADKPLRFATTVAQLMVLAKGKMLNARIVVALAVLEGVQKPIGIVDEDKERIAIQLWEKRWKAAKRIAAELRRLRGPNWDIRSSP